MRWSTGVGISRASTGAPRARPRRSPCARSPAGRGQPNHRADLDPPPSQRGPRRRPDRRRRPAAGRAAPVRGGLGDERRRGIVRVMDLGLHAGALAPVPMRIPLLILVLLNVAAAVLVLGGRDGPAISESSAIASPSPAGPARIIPCSAAAADWVALLVPPGRVAALPEQVARYSIIGDSEAWSDTPRFAAVETESLLARSPDLVLVSRFTAPATVQRIKEAGLEVVVVVEPGTWEGILEAGRLVAEATGTLEAWPGVAASLEARREALAVAHPDPHVSSPATAPRTSPRAPAPSIWLCGWRLRELRRPSGSRSGSISVEQILAAFRQIPDGRRRPRQPLDAGGESQRSAGGARAGARRAIHRAPALPLLLRLPHDPRRRGGHRRLPRARLNCSPGARKREYGPPGTALRAAGSGSARLLADALTPPEACPRGPGRTRSQGRCGPSRGESLFDPEARPKSADPRTSAHASHSRDRW